jgi:acyl-ACP thioesterase
MKSKNKQYRPIWNEKFTIWSYAVDVKKRLKTNYLTAFLQEAAWKHAQHLDLGSEFLHANGLVWMLSRILFEVTEYPVWKEEIIIETWPKGSDGIFYVRDFIIKGSSGEKLAVATSYWLLVDINSKRPKIPGFHSEILFMHKNKHAIDKKLVKFKSNSQIEKTSLKVQYSDLDLNQHVNSNKYVEWIINTLPYSENDEIIIESMQVNYSREIKFGEEIMLTRENNQIKNEFLIEGKIKSDRKLCFQAIVKTR